MNKMILNNKKILSKSKIDKVCLKLVNFKVNKEINNFIN